MTRDEMLCTFAAGVTASLFGNLMTGLEPGAIRLLRVLAAVLFLASSVFFFTASTGAALAARARTAAGDPLEGPQFRRTFNVRLKVNAAVALVLVAFACIVLDLASRPHL